MTTDRVLGPERRPHVLVEQSHRVLSDRVRRRVVAPGQREQLAQGEARLEQREPAPHEVDVARGEALLAVDGARHEDPGLDDRTEQGRGDPGSGGDVVERQGHALATGTVGARGGGGHGGGHRGVGGVELTVEEPADDREREAPLLEVADAGQPVGVLVAVPGDPAPADRRGEQAALLVEADGVDGDVGRPGEVLHPQRGRLHDPAF